MCIYESYARGLRMSSEAHKDCSNGGGGRSKELVNSKNPTLPLIKLPDEGTWAETWYKKRKWQPTNGQENYKLPRCPRAMVSTQSNHIQSDSVNDVTSLRVKRNKSIIVQPDSYGHS
jgi:hypothetical protein